MRNPMIILLLPLVAAILFFYPKPDRYAVSRQPANELQTALYGRLQAAGLQGNELATVGALTLGYKQELDPQLKKLFQASGAAHVLAVSGLHTGIIYGVLIWLLTFGGRLKPQYENRIGRWCLSLVVIAAMWGYAWLTGMTPSVVRAVLMVSVYEIGRMAYRQAFSLNTVATAAFIILVVRPTDLWSVSFQLSFAATAAIIILCSGFTYIRFPALRYLITVLLVSLAAQLGTLPLTMYYFGQFSNYFLLTNLIVLPLATLLVPCGLLTVAFGGCWAGLALGRITGWLAGLMNHAVGWIEHLPGSTTQVQIDAVMVGIYYIIFIIFCFFFRKTD